MRNIKLLLQYEGTRYQGWQRQRPSDNTVQGKLETLLSRMCGEPVELQASGRTDAGVHAAGQVANFHTNSDRSVEEMRDYINAYLPEDIAVLTVEEAAPRFHSRLNARGKRYRYCVLDGGARDVFWRRYALEIPERPDVDAMRAAAALLVGEHDFKSFTSAKKGKKSTVRRLDCIDIERRGKLLIFTFEGNGFLHHMVRILMGTLLEVGTGKRAPESMTELLAARNREEAGFLAPARGLTLTEVFF